MKNMHKNLPALALASAILSTTPALAETQPAPGGYGPMMGGPGMMQGYGPGGGAGIELSSVQRAKSREIQRELFKKESELREKMFMEHGQIEDLYDVDKPDPKAVRAAYDRLYNIRKEMIEARIQARNKMYDLLTDDQRKTWSQQRRQWSKGWGHMGMMGPGYGYGPMGPGMMGSGYGYGPMAPGWGGYGPMGPGMMGPGYGPWWDDED